MQVHEHVVQDATEHVEWLLSCGQVLLQPPLELSHVPSSTRGSLFEGLEVTLSLAADAVHDEQGHSHRGSAFVR